MRKFLPGCLIFFICCYGEVLAQNKTLGVGVAAPNPNAALHVESPTGNQGFIMPRLNSLQRTSMSALLTEADKGLMIYDTNLNTLFIWDGLAWKSSSQVAGGPQLVYPYADTVTTSPGPNTNVFKLLYSGSATENVGVAHFENQNANNTEDVISAVTNGLGSAGHFTINNTTSKVPALWAETNSDSALSAPIYGLNTGRGDVAASFRITNTGNPFPALFAESNGTGRAATFRKLGTTGTQPAVFVDSRGGHGIWADHNSATGFAAIVQTINTANPSAGMLVESIGTGASVWALKSTDAVSGDALRAENAIASGSAAKFVLTDAANASHSIFSTTPGLGAAGFFEQTNGSVLTPALMVTTNGMGAAFNATSTATSTNANAAEFIVQNTANPRNAVMAVSQGTGSAGNFSVDNASSGSAALFTSTNGTGAAFQAQTSTGFAAIYARREGASNGNAGLFDIIEATNTYPALQANTAGGGSAVNAVTTGTGSAGSFNNNNASSSAPAVYAQTNGIGAAINAQTATGASAIYAKNDGAATGNAGVFENSGAANTYPALQAITAGSGSAFHALHNGSTGDALYAERAGTGTGSAGNFRIQDANNNASALFAATFASGGSALGASNDANGVALSIFKGGLQVSARVINEAIIAEHATAYYIASGGTSFTFSFPTNDGEVFLVYNQTGQIITVAGVTLANGEGKTLVVFPGGIIAGF